MPRSDRGRLSTVTNPRWGVFALRQIASDADRCPSYSYVLRNVPTIAFLRASLPASPPPKSGRASCATAFGHIDRMQFGTIGLRYQLRGCHQTDVTGFAICPRLRGAGYEASAKRLRQQGHSPSNPALEGGPRVIRIRHGHAFAGR